MQRLILTTILGLALTTTAHAQEAPAPKAQVLPVVQATPEDDLAVHGAIIVNAVKCLPPQNKPTPEEIRTCRPFLEGQIAALPKVRVFIALGQIAHQSAVKALGGKLPKAKFGHLAEHRLPDGRMLIDSYHCSRYNTNTGRLTAAMFEAVFARAQALRDG